jgi:aldose 1-epimerase
MYPHIQRAGYGFLSDGRAVDAVTLTNRHGLSVNLLTLGASVQALRVPDRAGRFTDIALGFDSVRDYEVNRECFGVTLGRFANRIAGAAFDLDGHHWALTANEGQNTLHGGAAGFGRRLWTLDELEPNLGPCATMRLDSPDGDEGFPGALAVTATFKLTEDALVIHYRATTSAATVVNLSNHTYFNLAGADGAEDILQHELTLPSAAAYLPVNDASIPTGEIRPVAGSVFDFRQPTPIGQRIGDADPQLIPGKGYDHTWVVGNASGSALHAIARLRHPKSGRVLDVSSNQPGLQFYSGNHLDGTATGKSGRLYGPRHGLSLEAQRFPDAPNQPAFPSARLAPGETYDNWIVYRFWVSE